MHERVHRHPPAPHAGQRTESVMSDALMPSGQPNRIVLYNAADGRVTVNVHFAQDNFWLPQRAIAELFGVGVAAISKHLKNIFESQELTEAANF